MGGPRAQLVTCSRTPTRASWGGLLAEVLVVLATAGVIAAAAIVIVPSALTAAPSPSGPVSVASPQRQRIVDLLGALVSQSHALLAVDRRRTAGGHRTPFVQVALWMEDHAEPGVVNLGEVGLLAHSAISQVVSFTTVTPDESPGPALDARAVTAGRIGELLRQAEGSRTRVLARGVSDLSLISRGEGRTALMEITLTWADRSADSIEKAVTVVEAPWVRPLE